MATIIERERILRDAARRYLAGEVTYEELTRIRRETDGLQRAALAQRPAGSEG